VHREGVFSIAEQVLRQRIGEMVEMGFYPVWGFDPDEVIKARQLSRGESDEDESEYNADDRRAARIPADADEQIYELRRMFRL
jgi:hypothetical protein